MLLRGLRESLSSILFCVLAVGVKGQPGKLRSGDTQFFLHLLQRDPLGFGVDKQDHKKLKAHH
jgi:hypothetical protein